MHILKLLESSRISNTLQLYVPRPKGVNEMFKPKADANTLWTSTAHSVGDKYSSEWVEWCKYEMPHWLSSRGILFRVSGSAKVLNLDSDRSAIEVASEYGIDGPNNKMDFDWIKNFPWDRIRKDYDGVHHIPSGGNFFMSGWDVESTVWFNRGKLVKVSEVEIDNEN